MEAAVATLSDSEVGRSGGKDGIRSRRVTMHATSSEMPRPSLPITTTPLADRVAR